MRRYVTLRPKSEDIAANVDGENYLGKTVYENTDARDTGLLDASGAKLYAVNKMEQIGFVRRPD